MVSWPSGGTNFGFWLECVVALPVFACVAAPNIRQSRLQFLSAMTKTQLQSLAKKHGTPLVVIDHDVLRKNYAEFKQHLPKVQCYFAVKANCEPAIIRTFYKCGASFDVASMPEFMMVYENIKKLPAKAQQDFIWDKIIYANPTKPKETLLALDSITKKNGFLESTL